MQIQPQMQGRQFVAHRGVMMFGILPYVGQCFL